MSDVLISAHQLTKLYYTKSSVVRALDAIDLDIRKGEIVAVVGESGSGKSTIAELLLGIQSPTSGDVRYRGKPLPAVRPRALKRLMQLVPQNPLSALNPRCSIFKSVALPLEVHSIGNTSKHREKVSDLLSLVGLPAEIMDRQPQVLSGGQRQRVAIARALASEPEIIILDEPTSALDVSVQARVLRLLIDIHRRFELTYIFITHDLAVARILANRVVVLYRGGIVESGPTADVLLKPRHRYTQMLVSSLPVVSAAEERLKPSWVWTQKVQIEGVGAATGCPFSPRCPHALPICFHKAPEMTFSSPDHGARCFNPGGGDAVPAADPTIPIGVNPFVQEPGKIS